MSKQPRPSMAFHSDAASATTITASTPKKSRSQHQNQNADYAKAWPFKRVDGKLLERAHRQLRKQHIETYEEAPF